MSEHPEHLGQAAERSITLGVVSFLNSRPLVEGLDREAGVNLRFAVPSALAGMLRGGEVDAALIPAIDLARSAGAWRRVSDACIGSDGPTMTVRVFSRVPPERMSELLVDGDSHTSVILARLIWSRWFKRRLRIAPLASVADAGTCESVLLIGDKVVTGPVRGFDYQVDLGEAWKKWTGLPFVFAVWAAPAGAEYERLAHLLGAARDRGVARAEQIAEEVGPARGWPVELAREYLTQRLMFKVTVRAREGISLFFEMAAQEEILPGVPELVG
jgi:chorismate dehydratase